MNGETTGNLFEIRHTETHPSLIYTPKSLPNAKRANKKLPVLIILHGAAKNKLPHIHPKILTWRKSKQEAAGAHPPLWSRQDQTPRH